MNIKNYFLLIICVFSLFLNGCSLSDANNTLDDISQKYNEAKDNVTDLVESIPAPASDFKTKEVDDNSVKITKYKGNNQKVVVPSTIKGKTVVEIDYFADEEDETVVTVELPSSVKKIGKHAFACMNALTTVTFAEGITEIGESAFGACPNLSNVNFPNSLKVIGIESFLGTALEQVTLPDSLEELGHGAFALCNKLKSIDFGKGLLYIPEEACSVCEKLESADLGNAQIIMDNAFSGCSKLEKVKMLQGMEIYPDTFPNKEKTKIEYYDKAVEKEPSEDEDGNPTEEEYDDSIEKELLW